MAYTDRLTEFCSLRVICRARIAPGERLDQQREPCHMHRRSRRADRKRRRHSQRSTCRCRGTQRSETIQGSTFDFLLIPNLFAHIIKRREDELYI